MKELITAPSSGSTLWNTSVLNETTCDAYEWHGENSNIAKALAVATGWGEYDDDCTVGYDQSTNNSTCFSAVPTGYFYGSDNIWDDSGFYCCVYSANFLSTTQSDELNTYSRGIFYFDRVTYRSSSKSFGQSVRCVRD